MTGINGRPHPFDDRLAEQAQAAMRVTKSSCCLACRCDASSRRRTAVFCSACTASKTALRRAAAELNQHLHGVRRRHVACACSSIQSRGQFRTYCFLSSRMSGALFFVFIIGGRLRRREPGRGARSLPPILCDMLGPVLVALGFRFRTSQWSLSYRGHIRCYMTDRRTDC